jgi:hypothetical protein
MPRAGLKPMILVFKREKLFRALDRGATVLNSNFGKKL